jgi:nucleoside-diphosphate-sugar epimerase
LDGKPRFHHVSSVAIAGADFRGRFTEDMFDEGQDLDHPYYRTKFESERIVREESKIPFRVYRPGMVVGSSKTGEMDKVDGPYYFFKRIKTVRDHVPKWLPVLGIDGGRMPIAPVDYVADAIDHIAHQPGRDGQAFFLLQRPEPTVGAMLRTFLHAAHGPDIAANFDLNSVPGIAEARKLAGRLPLSRTVARQISDAVGIPVSIFGYVVNRTDFDDSNARAALAGSKIKCPKLEDYADKLWAYWEMHLHHDYKVSPRAAATLRGKVVVVTGASSGIGNALAKKLALARARVVLVARTRERLEETREVISDMGGEAHVYPCDLTDMGAIDSCVESIQSDLGRVDILVNNAGRSIRRSVWESRERFHDYERTMQLNYFGAVRMITALLPRVERRLSRQHASFLGLCGEQSRARRLRTLSVGRSAQPAHSGDDRVHAARAHADDRSDEERQLFSDHHARGGRGPDREGHGRQAEARFDRARYVGGDQLRALAETQRFRFERGFPDVSVLVGRTEQEFEEVARGTPVARRNSIR